ncbi:MAG: TetR/AcrR family transcriptional regulator [Deinococcota bacterium]
MTSMGKSEKMHTQSLRHQPQQARSHATIQHILDVAAKLYAEKGFDNVSTNYIAKQAKISVGSLYRFFPNKEAILSTLVDHYIDTLKTVLPTSDNVDIPMADVARLMIKSVLGFRQKHPAMSQIMGAPYENHMPQAAMQMHLTLKAWIEETLSNYYPELGEQDRYLCAAASMGMVRGMLGMMQPPDKIAPDQTIDEIVTALMAYVDAFVSRST